AFGSGLSALGSGLSALLDPTSLPALVDAGNSRYSTTAASTARATISSIGSARSAASMSARRARVSGLRGVNSVQQSWSGMMDIGYDPIFVASAVISSL